MLNVSMTPVEALRPNPRNAKTHPRKQIRALADIIANLGFWSPILADKKGKILAVKPNSARLRLQITRSRKARVGTEKSFAESSLTSRSFWSRKVSMSQ